MADCTRCGHPTRGSSQRKADFPGTLVRKTRTGLCERCYKGSPVPRQPALTCRVCGRRLRAWGVRAEQDPSGVQRGDPDRCTGCKYGDREVLSVDELNENEVSWVERNVPKDLHWYFGVSA